LIALTAPLHTPDNAIDEVYYLPSLDSYRKRGIGTALVRHVINVARDAGFADLYLFTPSQENFYQTLGWATISKALYRGEHVTVMRYRLQG